MLFNNIYHILNESYPVHMERSILYKTSRDNGLLVQIRPSYDRVGIVQKPMSDSCLDYDALCKFVQVMHFLGLQISHL